VDQNAALARLIALCPPDALPCLDTSDLELILDAARRPDYAGNPPTNVDTTGDWTASSATLAGTVVQQPATKRWWRAVNSGTTGAAAPEWPNLAGTVRTGQLLTDGTVTWEDHGAEWRPTWNVNAGLAFGWRLKANRAAALYDATDGDQNLRRAQVAAQCEQRAQRYERLARRSSEVA
jgi:hypothetical protein